MLGGTQGRDLNHEADAANCARLEERGRRAVVHGVELARVVLTQDACHINDDVGRPQAG